MLSFLFRFKKWKHFQRVKLLICEVLLWFKIKISCLIKSQVLLDLWKRPSISTPTIFTSVTLLSLMLSTETNKKMETFPLPLNRKCVYVWTAFEDLPLYVVTHMCLPQLAFACPSEGPSSLLPPSKAISFFFPSPKTSSFWFIHSRAKGKSQF